jgi:hypothetical protein
MLKNVLSFAFRLLLDVKLANYHNLLFCYGGLLRFADSRAFAYNSEADI